MVALCCGRGNDVNATIALGVLANNRDE